MITNPNPPLPPIKQLTLLKMKERHDKGIHYNCGKQLVPRPHCQKQQLCLLDATCYDDQSDDELVKGIKGGTEETKAHARQTRGPPWVGLPMGPAHLP